MAKKIIVLAFALLAACSAAPVDSSSAECDASTPDVAVQNSDASREEVSASDVRVEVVTPIPDAPSPDVASEDAVDASVVLDAEVVEPDAASDVSMVDTLADVVTPDASVSTDVPTAPPGSRIYRSRDGRGDFWFCGEYPGYPGAQYGYRGCCTNGRWSRPEDFGRAPGISAGTYVRSLASEVVYYIMEQRGTLVRVRMPTSKVLLSIWSHPSFVEASLLLEDPAGCSVVEEADEAALSALPEAGTALFRAGTVFTSRLGDRYRYIAGPNRTLHPIRIDGVFTGMGHDIWTSTRLHVLPHPVFDLYTIGAPIDVMFSDDPRTVLARYTSMERLIDLFP